MNSTFGQKVFKVDSEVQNSGKVCSDRKDLLSRFPSGFL